jgi:cytoskeletal protein RodZ
MSNESHMGDMKTVKHPRRRGCLIGIVVFFALCVVLNALGFSTKEAGVPDTTGTDAASAVQDLNNAGFKNIKGKEIVSSADNQGVSIDLTTSTNGYTVVSQSPNSGSIKTDSEITLTVEVTSLYEKEKEGAATDTSAESSNTTSSGNASTSEDASSKSDSEESATSSSSSTSALSETTAVSYTRLTGEKLFNKFKLHTFTGNLKVTDLGDGTFNVTCDCDVTDVNGNSVKDARCVAVIGGTDANPTCIAFSVGNTVYIENDE